MFRPLGAGDGGQDITLALEQLENSVTLPEGTPESSRPPMLNKNQRFSAAYRRDPGILPLASFTTMRRIKLWQ